MTTHIQHSKKESGLPAFGSAKGDQGFTLVEVMVSLAIFATIITMGMQAVLSSMQQHRATQNVRTVMDNLNFIMEDMARNIRLGTDIHCIGLSEILNPDGTTSGGTGAPWYDSSFNVSPQSCPVGSSGIVFNGLDHTAGDGKFITYVFTSPYASTPNVIIKQKGAVAGTEQVITPPEVTIDPLKSGFIVRGAEVPTSSNPDFAQPTVVIHMAGTIKDREIETPFSIQTSVVLRALDRS